MGREFMTQKEAVKKVGASLSSASKLFCTAAWLAGHSGIFDINQLTGYGNEEFVSEMHIKPAIVTTKYKITVPSLKIAIGLDPGTPRDFSILNKSAQLSEIKAVLCAIVDGGVLHSNPYSPTDANEQDTNYSIPYLQFSNMEVSVWPSGCNIDALYVVLYNDSHTIVQYQGRNISNLMYGNNFYRSVKTRMRNTTDYSSDFNGESYDKLYSVTDTNSVTVDCRWAMMVPLVDDGKSVRGHSVQQHLDSLPTNVTSNRITYNYVGVMLYNNLAHLTPTTES